VINHPDPPALAGRTLADAGLEPGSLTLSRADVEQLLVRSFAFGAAAGVAGIHDDRACRVCGCTQYRACPGSCSWVSVDLCSSCAPFVEGGR
jgi:hypothetical protein